jgi:hypothetical protein
MTLTHLILPNFVNDIRLAPSNIDVTGRTHVYAIEEPHWGEVWQTRITKFKTLRNDQR